VIPDRFTVLIYSRKQMLLGDEEGGGRKFCSPHVKNSWHLVKEYGIRLSSLDLLCGISDFVKIHITCIKLLL
jgi:hypothetical protein